MKISAVDKISSTVTKNEYFRYELPTANSRKEKKEYFRFESPTVESHRKI